MTVLPWLAFVGSLLIRLGVLGAALTVVRKGDARGGYALAAASGVSMLFLCCHRGMSVFLQSVEFEFERERYDYGMACVDGVEPLVVTALIAVAIVLLAKAAKPVSGAMPQ